MLTVAALALSGCSDSPKDQVRAKVQDLQQAAANHDYAQICGQILAPSLVAHLRRTGIGCQRAMRVAWADVHDPVISIGKLIVHGPRAWAITLTSARGQRAYLASIALLRTRLGWRILALDSPLTTAGR